VVSIQQPLRLLSLPLTLCCLLLIGDQPAYAQLTGVNSIAGQPLNLGASNTVDMIINVDGSITINQPQPPSNNITLNVNGPANNWAIVANSGATPNAYGVVGFGSSIGVYGYATTPGGIGVYSSNTSGYYTQLNNGSWGVLTNGNGYANDYYDVAAGRWLSQPVPPPLALNFYPVGPGAVLGPYGMCMLSLVGNYGNCSQGVYPTSGSPGAYMWYVYVQGSCNLTRVTCF
jgi:hypothetical protein